MGVFRDEMGVFRDERGVLEVVPLHYSPSCLWR